jgi:hypothetical protein
MSLETLFTFVPLSGAASVGFFLAMTWVVHVVSDHAAKHQGEEIETRDCLAQHGEWQVWREREGKYHRLCQTPAGEIFDQIVAWTGERWEEVTAFKPNPGAGAMSGRSSASG